MPKYGLFTIIYLPLHYHEIIVIRKPRYDDLELQQHLSIRSEFSLPLPSDCQHYRHLILCTFTPHLYLMLSVSSYPPISPI